MLLTNAQSRLLSERFGFVRGPHTHADSLLRRLTQAVGVAVALYGTAIQAAEVPASRTSVSRSANDDSAPGLGLRVKVAKGETASAIARRHGTTVKALCAANGLADPHRIYAGQVLTIPVTFESEFDRPGVSTATPAASVENQTKLEPAQPSHRPDPATGPVEVLATDVRALSALAEAPAVSGKVVLRPAPLVPRERHDASRFERFGLNDGTPRGMPSRTTLIDGALDVTEPYRQL